MADRVLLVRHCEEEPGLRAWPSFRELVDWQRSEGGRPLTPAGRQDAERLAEKISEWAPDTLRTSPLRRARETSDRLAARLGLTAEVDPELAEISFGEPPLARTPCGRLRVPRRTGFALMRSLWLAGMTRGVDTPGGLTERARTIATGLRKERDLPVVVSHGVVLVYLLSMMVHPEERARPRRGHLLRSGELVVVDRLDARWRISARWRPRGIYTAGRRSR
jgi:broad specificity phosphatase PhoE